MSFEIRPATRTGIKPLIGLSGVSGGGKTRSALLLARGIVGPKGRITLVDSESGRGHIFADKIPGGYSVIDLTEPFTPDRYTEAFCLAEANSDIVVVDSISHEWMAVLEAHEEEVERLAGDDYRKREAVKFTAWIKPKMAHKQFLGRLLRAKIPLICCFRSEIKTKISRKDGKTAVTTSELPEPIFDPRFFFEMLICTDVYSVNGHGGFLHILKITHEDLYSCLPTEDKQVSVEHGEQLAKWCVGTPIAAKPVSRDGELKKLLWDMTKGIHCCAGKADMEAAKQRLSQWLWDEGLMSDTESLSELAGNRLAEVCDNVGRKLEVTP